MNSVEFGCSNYSDVVWRMMTLKYLPLKTLASLFTPHYYSLFTVRAADPTLPKINRVHARLFTYLKVRLLYLLLLTTKLTVKQMMNTVPSVGQYLNK